MKQKKSLMLVADVIERPSKQLNAEPFLTRVELVVRGSRVVIKQIFHLRYVNQLKWSQQ